MPFWAHRGSYSSPTAVTVLFLRRFPARCRNVGVILCLGLLEGSLSDLSILAKLAMGFIGGLVSGIFVAGISPLFESVFPYTTDIKLLELANLNQPIFQRMIIEAPGTYHHSVVLGSMVEAAAESIGANSLLAKVGAYYHTSAN